MINIEKPIAFVLISSNHGTMIINRNDYRMIDKDRGYGVSYELLSNSSYSQQEVNFALALLNKRRANFGAGVIALDCGANVGVHTIEWARFMDGWGEVTAFVAQEKIYYALAGNVAINNCLNVTAKNVAVGSQCGSIDIPDIDYFEPSSYGSFELRKTDHNEFIGQKVNYEKTRSIALVSIDSLALRRLDLIKIDVEGMKIEVLKGAQVSIEKISA